MPKIKEIAHAVINVSDLERSTRWYCDVLGMEVVVPASRFPGCFLSFGQRDHDIALFQSNGSIPGGVEYNHLAFELDGDLKELKQFRQGLVQKGVTITGTVDHGISYGVYFLDPDGHQLEVFYPVPTRKEAKQNFKDIGPVSKPVDLDLLEV